MHEWNIAWVLLAVATLRAYVNGVVKYCEKRDGKNGVKLIKKLGMNSGYGVTLHGTLCSLDHRYKQQPPTILCTNPGLTVTTRKSRSTMWSMRRVTPMLMKRWSGRGRKKSRWRRLGWGGGLDI